MHKGKQADKRPRDKLSLIKRFITGDIEDIAQEIIYNNSPRITGMIVIDSAKYLSKLSADQLNELRLIKDERERTKRLYEIIREKEGEVWLETKDYQPRMKVYADPELAGISYDNPANVPVIDSGLNSDTSEISERSDKKKIDARNEPVNAPTRQQMHRLFLQAEMARIKDQEKLDLEARNNSILWNRMNSGFI